MPGISLGGNALGSVLFLGAMVFLVGLNGFPRSVFLIDFVLCTTTMGASRLALRMLREYRESPNLRHATDAALIVGAGSAGIRLRDEIEHYQGHTVVTGFIDDDTPQVGATSGRLPRARHRRHDS